MLKQINIYYPDPIDQELIHWLSEVIKIEELKKYKPLTKIITEDVAPKIPDFIERLGADDIISLWEREIINTDGELQPLGKGYVACLLTSI